jgi:hypothetical protein
MTKFTKGQSGNEAGRPKGTTAAAKIRKDIEKAMPGILATVVKAAEKGDTAAAKILLDRLCPTLKPVALPIYIPFPVDGGLSQTGDNVIKATLTGQIPTDIGAALITALSNQGKLVEIDDLTKRIEALEKQK